MLAQTRSTLIVRKDNGHPNLRAIEHKLVTTHCSSNKPVRALLSAKVSDNRAESQITRRARLVRTYFGICYTVLLAVVVGILATL